MELEEDALADEHVAVYLKHLLELAKIANAEFDEALALDNARNEATNRTIKGVREYAEQLELETSLMGLSNAERAKQIALLELERAGKDRNAKDVQDLANSIRDQIALQEQLRNQASVWDELSSAAGSFFSDLIMNGKSAFDNLKRYVKDLLAEMIALFAKRWVLNMAAGGSMLGSAGSALAGGFGDGSMAGGGLGGLGSLLTGSPLGLAIGGVGIAAALYSMFNDGPENPNFRWMQGTGGPGAFGGISSQGNYDFANSAALTGYVGGLDRRFANILGPGGSAAATSALAGYTQAGLRMDGSQPAQFAFPEGTDAEAAEQLAKELLQSRYGILFEQIDAELADQVKNFSGSSADLQVFIETALGVIEGLGGLGIKGLDIDTLQAMQKEGESLGETFERLANTWAWFNENFYTDAEKLELAGKQVNDTFAALGIEVPSTITDFRKLVQALDLSSAANRAMYDSLMAVAPAFLEVSNAMKETVEEVKEAEKVTRRTTYDASANRELEKRRADPEGANTT